MPTFEETRRVYGKPEWKGMSQCPHTSCRATNPPVRKAMEHELQSISDDIRNLAKTNEIQICGYCSGLWWEDAGTVPPSFVLLGSRSSL